MTTDPTNDAGIPARDDRSISVGRDAHGNAFVTGDNNHVTVVVYQTVRPVEQADARSQASGQSALSGNPYVGLSAFHEEDAKYFFGRENLIEQLWNDLSRLHAGLRPRFLPILGPSGCGKSSLARAGLIPELAERPLPGWKDSRIAVLTPGTRPLESLAAILARVETEDCVPFERKDAFAKRLMQPNNDGDYDGLLGVANTLPDIEAKPLVVFVDQFEEVYSLCNSTSDRNAFIENLLFAACDASVRVSVVITLRTDFLEETQAHETLNQLVCSKEQMFIVPAMTSAELRRSITRPAQLFGHPLDDDTVDTLIEQTRGREGALPLLQFALTRIWEGLADGKQPGETLEEIGGVGGALADKATSIFDGLNEGEKDTARRMLLGLVQLDDGVRATRRRASISSLVGLGDNPRQARDIIRCFSAAGVRLLTVSSSEGDETVEVTHEALLDRWTQFREWIEQHRGILLWRSRLEPLLLEWQGNRQSQTLLRGNMLLEAEGWLERRADDLTSIEQDFIRASRAQQRREKGRIWRYRAAGIALLVLATSVLLTLATLITRSPAEAWMPTDVSAEEGVDAVLIVDQQGTERILVRLPARHVSTARADVDSGEYRKTIVELQTDGTAIGWYTYKEYHDDPVDGRFTVVETDDSKRFGGHGTLADDVQRLTKKYFTEKVHQDPEDLFGDPAIAIQPNVEIDLGDDAADYLWSYFIQGSKCGFLWSPGMLQFAGHASDFEYSTYDKVKTQADEEAKEKATGLLAGGWKDEELRIHEARGAAIYWLGKADLLALVEIESNSWDYLTLTLRSEDGGQSWTAGAIHREMNGRSLTAIARGPGSDNVLYASFADKSEMEERLERGGVYRSSDGGLTWQNMQQVPEWLSYWSSYSSIAVGAQEEYIALGTTFASLKGGDLPRGVPGVIRTRDGGSSWQVLGQGLGTPRGRQFQVLAITKDAHVIALIDSRLAIWRKLTLLERLRGDYGLGF